LSSCPPIYLLKASNLLKDNYLVFNSFCPEWSISNEHFHCYDLEP
jgi:hypothetical protein